MITSFIIHYSATEQNRNGNIFGVRKGYTLHLLRPEEAGWWALHQQMDEARFHILDKLAFGGLRDKAHVRANFGILRDRSKNPNSSQAQQPQTNCPLSIS